MFAYVCNLSYMGVRKTLGPSRSFQIGLILTCHVNSGKKVKMSHYIGLGFFFSFLLSSHWRNSAEFYAAFTVFSFWQNTEMMNLSQLSVTQGVSWASSWECPLAFDPFYVLLFSLFKSLVKLYGNCSQPWESFYFILKGTEPMAICLLSLLSFLK